MIDGLQRLSTLFQFVGILTDEQKGLVPPLELRETIYLPSLKGMLWNSDNPDLMIPDELKRTIKRSKIHVSIVLKESDENTKYDLFQRLNTGGSQLSPQEVRNCILVMVNKDFYLWLNGMTKSDAFQETLSLSDKPLAEAYDTEQVLRFLILGKATDDELASVGDVGVYLNTKMVELAKDAHFDRDGWKKLFDDTFTLLQQSVSDKAFKRYSVAKGRHEGGFLVSQFEAVACGVAWNLANDTLRDDVAGAIAGIWSEPDFTEWTGSGITASRRLRRIIPFARQYFAK